MVFFNFAKQFILCYKLIFLRDEKARVFRRFTKREISKNLELVDLAVSTDDQRKKIQFELDSQLSEMNKISKEIGALMKEGKKRRS